MKPVNLQEKVYEKIVAFGNEPANGQLKTLLDNISRSNLEMRFQKVIWNHLDFNLYQQFARYLRQTL